MKLCDRRAKIVATIGPATASKEALEKAIRSGMNVARLNFSHGTHEDHAKVIGWIRELTVELAAPVSLLQDLQGPKVRVGRFAKGSIPLKPGQTLQMTVENIQGDENLIPSDFPELIDSVHVGSRVLLDDGLIELVVKNKISNTRIEVEVIFGGILKDRKGMNLPGARLPVECMTDKDLQDLKFGLAHKVDFVALSFVRKGKDIRQLRELIDASQCDAKIIAKIEMWEALENLEEITRLSDAVMVARGDLAVEVGQSRLPGFQKKIISLCNRLGKPVITATQMLDSMVENPRPTRAEITDVANAVLDGSDALMLSAETASGAFPFQCLQTMHEIIVEVERNEEKYYKLSLDDEFLSVPASIAASASLSALKLKATSIVCLTTTGKTANIIAAFRPKAKIFAVTDRIDVLNKMELSWGIQTLGIQPYKTMEDVLVQMDQILVEYGLGKTGDRVILTLGQPIETGSKTNSIFVHTIGAEEFHRLDDSRLPLRCRRNPHIPISIQA